MQQLIANMIKKIAENFKPIDNLEAGRTDLAAILRRTAIMREFTPKGKTLDIGCADGLYCKDLLKRGADEYVGVDTDVKMLRQASHYCNGSFILADATYLPFREDCFDFVLALEVLEHIENYEQALLEIRRILKTASNGVLSVPAFSIGKFLYISAFKVVGIPWDWRQSKDHKREFAVCPLLKGLCSIKDFKSTLEKNGLFIVTQTPANALGPFDRIVSPKNNPRLTRILVILDKILGSFLPNWGNYLIFEFFPKN